MIDVMQWQSRVPVNVSVVAMRECFLQQRLLRWFMFPPDVSFFTITNADLASRLASRSECLEQRFGCAGRIKCMVYPDASSFTECHQQRRIDRDGLVQQFSSGLRHRE